MKVFYITFITILTVGMLVGGLWMRKRQEQSVKHLPLLMFTACGTMLMYCAFFLSHNVTAALFFQGVYLAFTFFLVIHLFLFIHDYTEANVSRRKLLIILYSLASVDTISFILNTFFCHMFRLAPYEAPNGDTFYVLYDYSILFYLRMLCVYSIIMFVFAILVIKAFSVPQYYRKKYRVMIFPLIITIVLNGISLFSGYPIDFSILFYAILAALFSYFALSYIPTMLVRNTLSLVVKDMNNAIFCFDINNHCIFYNDTAKQLLLSDSDTNSIEAYISEWLPQKIKEIDFYQRWNETRYKDNVPIYYELEFQKLFYTDGSFIGSYLSVEDRTEIIKSAEKERYLATHDALTGLYNREYFFELVEKKISEAPNVPRYMICSNIKDFKLINDLYGEQVGNQMLIEQSEMVCKNIENKKDAIFARIMGDKFALCIPKDEFSEQRFLELIAQLKHTMLNGVYRVQIYTGIYEIKPEDTSAMLMFDRADFAINTIKGIYDQTIAHYTDDLLARSLKERALIGEFEASLKHNHFCIYLQPQTDKDGKMHGAEALVRWIHPERGFISPGDFIPVFERAGLIHKLDVYVWELAAQQLRKWKDAGHPEYHISVNISTKDIFYLDLYQTFTELVEKYDISPSNLKLEITETAVMSNIEQCIDLIERLRAYGFEFEIDDFGSGYSSLNTLKDLNADVVKIDMGFLRETENKVRSRIILNSVISMSQQLNLSIITEGVETIEQLEFLSAAGCQMFQGYYFSKPLPVDAFEEKYFTNHSF